jgi:predicted membrane metal-binding protein
MKNLYNTLLFLNKSILSQNQRQNLKIKTFLVRFKAWGYNKNKDLRTNKNIQNKTKWMINKIKVKKIGRTKTNTSMKTKLKKKLKE